MSLQKILIPAYVDDDSDAAEPGHPDNELPSTGHPDNSLPGGPGRPIVSPPIYLPGHPSHPIYPVGGSPGHPSHQPIYPTLPVDPDWSVPEGPPSGCDGAWIPVDPGYGFPILGWLPIDPGWGRPKPPGNSTLPIPPAPGGGGGWVPIDPGFGNGGKVPIWVWLPFLLSGIKPPTPPTPQPKA